MRYAMIICASEDETVTPEEQSSGMQEVYAWFEKWGGAGKVVDGGAELQASATARTIRGAGAGQSVTDGPFIETKEAIGGFVLLEADSLDEALEVAGTWPGLTWDSVTVEVRPTVDHSGDGAMG